MRIVYLHQHFSSRQGSFGTRSYEFARLLTRQGHQVTLVVGRWDRSGLPPASRRLVDEYDLQGVRVLALNVQYTQSMSYFRRILAFIGFMLLATWVTLRQRGADVIYATSTPLTIAVPAMIASLIGRKPFVFEVRDLWPEVPVGLGILRSPLLIRLARLLERLAYRRAKHIVALSPGMRDHIIASGIAPGKVTVIPNSSDNDLFGVPPEAGQQFRAQHPEWGDGPLVVYTGAFGLVNNLSYLLRVAERVRRLDDCIRFVLIGSGSQGAELRALAAELGLLDQTVWILDPAPRETIPAVLSAAALATSTVLPNPVLWANSANKFFDALAAGKPIAINHEGWQADLLRESGAGLVLDADDLDRAAQQVVQAVHDPAWLAQAGQAAKRLATERFARERLALTLEQVLRDAAD